MTPADSATTREDASPARDSSSPAPDGSSLRRGGSSAGQTFFASGARARRGAAYDPRFSDDTIGIFVPAGPDQARQLEQMLRNAGAAEVRHEGA